MKKFFFIALIATVLFSCKTQEKIPTKKIQRAYAAGKYPALSIKFIKKYKLRKKDLVSLKTMVSSTVEMQQNPKTNKTQEWKIDSTGTFVVKKTTTTKSNFKGNISQYEEIFYQKIYKNPKNGKRYYMFKTKNGVRLYFTLFDKNYGFLVLAGISNTDAVWNKSRKIFINYISKEELEHIWIDANGKILKKEKSTKVHGSGGGAAGPVSKDDEDIEFYDIPD